MKPLPNAPVRSLSSREYVAVFTALAAAMIATRVSHFGDALRLPDASMAVFFLGGLYLRGAQKGWRTHLPFFVFAALAGVLDWASISLAGVSDFCITVAYGFLLPAYAVLWYGGRWTGPRDARGLLGAAAVALLSAIGSYLVSNGAFYWFGGRYADPHLAEYFARLWQWGPLFVRTAMAYVVVVLAVHGLMGALARTGRARRAAEV